MSLLTFDEVRAHLESHGAQVATIAPNQRTWIVEGLPSHLRPLTIGHTAAWHTLIDDNLANLDDRGFLIIRIWFDTVRGGCELVERSERDRLVESWSRAQ